MPSKHGPAIQAVADRTGHAIMFRAPGTQSTRLLEEGYAAKGFRIDTKSCDWGPMRGFVCVDPRFSKVAGDSAKVDDNRRYTAEALGGQIRHDAVGGLEGVPSRTILGDWMSGCKPVVISKERFDELARGGLAGLADTDRIIHGQSADGSATLRIPWALVPAEICGKETGYLAQTKTLPPGGYGVFIDHTQHRTPFAQELPVGINPPTVMGYQPILGLTNPDSDSYGYRACVTGDYDLFGVWPPYPRLDPFAVNKHWDIRYVDAVKVIAPGIKHAHHHQHHRLGNITGRLNMVKVLLNTAFIGLAGSDYPGGNLVHHSDEIGNPSPGLKKSLKESMPILAFLPDSSWGRRAAEPILIEGEADFKEFVGFCRSTGIKPQLRPEWEALFPE